MEHSARRPPVVIITGMHRSGTSLVSSLLQSAGLDIGQRLSGPGPGNVRGYFEDLDFNELHMDLLQSQGLPGTGYTLQPASPVNPRQHRRACALLSARRARATPWGWKDPRTTLFLDFWHTLIPEAGFVLLYRAPWEVVDSLFRRGDDEFLKTPSFAVRLWMHYNQLLLAFHERYPARCLLVNSQRAALARGPFLQALTDKLHLHLGQPASLFEAPLFHTGASSRWPSLFGHHFPEAVALYDELSQRARKDCPQGDTLAGADAPRSCSDDGALQDWLEQRVLERQYKALQAREESVQGHLDQARSEVAGLRGELDRAQSEIARLREELDGARCEAAGIDQERGELRAQLDIAQETISAMESSKFWKLRTAWLRLKGALLQAG